MKEIMSAEKGSTRHDKIKHSEQNLIGRYITHLLRKHRAKKLTNSILGYQPEEGQELILTHHSNEGTFNPNCGPKPCPDVTGIYNMPPFISSDGRHFMVEQKAPDGHVKQYSLLNKLVDETWQPTGWKIASPKNNDN